jgi:hypothetical protein
LVNGVTMKPFHLPFPLVWQMAGIVFATLVIAGVRRLDERHDARHGSDAEEQP